MDKKKESLGVTSGVLIIVGIILILLGIIGQLWWAGLAAWICFGVGIYTAVKT